LENRESEDDKMLREVWKIVVTKVGKIGVAKTKGRRKETRGEGAEEGERKEEEEKEEEEGSEEGS